MKMRNEWSTGSENAARKRLMMTQSEQTENIRVCDLETVIDHAGAATSDQYHWGRSIVFMLLIYLTTGMGITIAQESDEYSVADTSSPRDTLRSFIKATNDLHALIQENKYLDRRQARHLAIAHRVLDCIDDSELPAFARTERAGEVAVCLKEILDRVQLPPWEEIPDKDEILAAGGLESVTDYRLPDTRITISRVEAGPRRHEYLFSPGTVDRAVTYFMTMESKPYRTEGPAVSKDFYRWFTSTPGHSSLARIVERLPDSMRFGRTLGIANWKWPGLIIVFLISIPLLMLAYRAHVHFTNQVRGESLLKYWLTLVFPISAMLIPLAVKFIAYRYLTLRSTPLYITDFITVLVTLGAILILIFAVSNRVAASIIHSPNINPAGLNAQFIRIVSKLISISAVVALFLIGGQYLGIPIATLFASAGIGGVAVALAAQDTLKTLFGTMNVLTDKPFRVGDRIIFKQYDGFVEDIGIRSTSLRLLNGHQVTLPNDQLSGNDIENVGRRKHIRRSAQIHIPLDTPYKSVERAVAIIREALHDHEGMSPDMPPKVFFDEFATSAFCIRFYYWFSPADFWKYKAFSEKVNFEIFQKYEAEGIQFSLPFRHTFWKHDDEKGPLDIRMVDKDSDTIPGDD